MAASQPERGNHRLEHYVLLERLTGRAARVWRARRRSDDLSVIIRIFAARDEAERRMVLAAAERASRLCHAAAARVLDYGRADRAVFVVSELAPGQPLDRWTERIGIPPIESAVAVVQQIARALAEAHEQGVTHHVLSPRNVFVVDRPGEVPAARLVDLGLAQCLWPWPPALSSALFMAPEQLASMQSARVYASASASMNQYSCAAVLYDLCTGGPPVVASSIGELVQAHASRELVPPSRINPQLSPALDHALLRALGRDPSQRFAQLGDFVAALTRLPSTSSNSGVRFIGVGMPGGVPAEALDGSDARTTWDAAFDERPTSETPLQALLARAQAMRSIDESQREVAGDPVATLDVEHEADTLPPPASAAVPEALAALRPAPLPAPQGEAPTAAVHSAPSSRPPRAPIGSFSSAPPAPGATASPRAASHAPPTLPEVSAVALRPAGARLALLAALGLGVLALLGLVLLLASGPRQAAPPAAVAAEPRVVPTVIVSGGANADLQPHAAAPSPVTDAPSTESAPSPAPAPESVRQLSLARPAAPERSESRAPAARPPTPRVSRPVAKAVRPPLGPATTSASRSRQSSAGPLAVAREADVAPATPQPQSQQSAAALDAHRSVEDAPAGEPAQVAAERSPEPQAQAGARPRAERAAVREPFAPDAFTMRIGEIGVHGSLPNSIVQRGIERIESRLRACYRAAAQRARRHGYGVLRVSVEVDEHGRARNPHSRGGSLPGLDACVADAALRIAARTAPDTGTVTTTFTLRFGP